MLITEAAAKYPGCIRTISGNFFNPLDPNPDSITIEDIAHGLSHQFRFGGHTKYPLTVAEHSVSVCRLLPVEHQLAGLLHDAAEGLGLPDLITPVKRNIPGYEEAENRVMEVIAKKFGFQWPLHQAVKNADRKALEIEWDVFKIGKKKKPMSPVAARKRFVSLYEMLTIKRSSYEKI